MTFENYVHEKFITFVTTKQEIVPLETIPIIHSPIKKMLLNDLLFFERFSF